MEKKNKIKTNFDSHEGPMALANKIGITIDLTNFVLIFVENCP